MGRKLVKQQGLEISTSLISSGLLFLETRSPRNEMKLLLKGSFMMKQNFGKGNIYSKSNFLTTTTKKQFPWPAMFRKPSHHRVLDIGV